MRIKIFLFLFFIIINTLYANEKLQKVTLQLSWFDQFQFAGYYIAKEKGFYKDEGLEVDIKPFKFGINAVEGVSEGKYDFSIGRETILLDKAKGKDIVALYALFQSSPLILLSTKESKINSISKFKNKKIMTTIDDASEVSIKAMISSKKVDFKKLKFLKHTHNINDLVNKKTDVISAYISKAPFELDKMNIQYNIFAPKDYGFDMYSDFLITSGKLIEKNYNQVLNFRRASLKGWQYAYENIEETVDLILKKYNSQNISREALIYEAKELKKLSYFKTNRLGYINKSKLQRIHDLYNVMGFLANKINLDTFIYNESSLYMTFSLEEKRFINENPVLIVGEKGNINPLNFMNEIGLHSGISNDYLDLISEKTGLRFIYDIDSKKNIKNKLRNKNIDFIISSHFLKNTFLKTTPYFQLNEELFKLKDRAIDIPKNIGILKFIYSKNRESLIKRTFPKIKIIGFDSIEMLVKALKTNTIEAIYLPKEFLLPYIKNNNINNIDFIEGQIETNVIPLSMLVNKDNTILKNILSKAISEITTEQHISIRNKWIPIVFENGKYDWTLFLQIMGIILFVIIMLVSRQISLGRVNKELSRQKAKLEEANKKLRELSELDHLTKLYNRRYFEQVLEDIIKLEERENNATSILSFDIDDFKIINDTYGHKAGDEVLKSLAKKLKEISRKSDIIARMGGEEFIILFPNTCLEGANIHAESIRKAIENLCLLIEGHEIKFTISIGLTSFRKNEPVAKVLTRVDNNMYEAKNTGKNKIIRN